MNENTFLMLCCFQFKHFLADFPLQNSYMLRKKLPDWGFFLPLFLHAGIHALMTALILIFFSTSLVWMAFIDFVIHFLMDRIKAGPRYLGRFDDLTSYAFWNCLGLDQMVHQFTYLGIVYYVAKAGGVS